MLDLDIEKPMCGLLDVLHAFGFRGDGLLLLTQLQFLSLFFYNNCFASLPVSKCLLYMYINLEKVHMKTILSNNKYKTFNCSEEIKTSLIGNLLVTHFL